MEGQALTEAMDRGITLLHAYYGMQGNGQCWNYPSSLLTARLCPLKRVGVIKACQRP